MCQFKSGEAVRISESEVKIFTIRLQDSHTDIRKTHSIREDSGMPSDKFHVPVELVPYRLDFDDPSAWEFIFDATKPDWWTDGMTEQAISQLLSVAKLDFEDWKNGKTVTGDLYLNGLTSIPEGFNPTVKGDLSLNGLTSLPKGFNPTVGHSLWMNDLTSIPEGFSPTVGGDLYLKGLTSIPDRFNPTVKGSLYLNGLRVPTMIMMSYPK